MLQNKIFNSIAVIIVTYNGEKWLDKCIKPLYGIDNIKIVVIDNGSTDNTVSIIKRKFNDVELIISNNNLGFGQANNIGFEYAIKNNFEFVFLLNQDASIDSYNLNKLINIYLKDKTLGILSPIHYKNETEVENLFQSYLENSNIKDKDININVQKGLEFVNAALWLISVENIIKIGGFNKLFFHYGEDVDYINRIKYFNLSIKVAMDTKGYHFRNYSKKSFKEKFVKSSYFGPWNIKYYTILSNINHTLFYALIISFRLFIISFLKYFIRGYFKSAKISIKVFYNVIKNLKMINKYRICAKEYQTPFLK